MTRQSPATQEFVGLLIDYQEVIRAYIITQIPGSPDVRVTGSDQRSHGLLNPNEKN